MKPSPTTYPLPRLRHHSGFPHLSLAHSELSLSREKSIFPLDCTPMEARLGLFGPLLGPRYCPSQSQAMYSITSNNTIY